MLVWDADEGREELGVVAPPVLWSDTLVLSCEWAEVLLLSSSRVGVSLKLALDIGLRRLKKLMVQVGFTVRDCWLGDVEGR